MAGKPLLLPLQAEDNRPIRDAAGQLVSIIEHAQAFVAAVNHLPLAIKAMDEAAGVLLGAWERAESDESADVLHEARIHLNDVARSAEKGAKLPAPLEATTDELAETMDRILDQDTGVLDFAKEIVKRYRVIPR